MANKDRGETTLKAGGEAYTVRLSYNAFCEVEDLLDKGFLVICEELTDPRKMRLKTVQTVLWVGLRVLHPELKLEDVGELIPKAGGLQNVVKVVNAAVRAAFPDPEPDARPQKAAGTNETI
jgi:hypothetical protein